MYDQSAAESGSACKNVAVLGCTGSIGKATLEVISELADRFHLFAASADRNAAQLCEIVERFRPEIAILSNAEVAQEVTWGQGKPVGQTCDYRTGHEALVEVAQDPGVDIVVAAIVGAAGMESCLAAADAGKRLALANKEALVVAGPLLTKKCQASGAELLPVDSEHSAIFQALQSGNGTHEISRLVLTASGGSLRDWPREELANASAKDALNHPTWKMGAKITIDSATMMNKALEIIEARWLFGVPADQISVVIHPQSMVHSMVEFSDGSVIAQLSPPDMRLPIQYSLTYPERTQGPARKLDWSQTMKLEWYPVDFERYPALLLGFEVAEAGGSSGAVLNAANEAAVSLFLEEKIRFTDITKAVGCILHQHNYVENPSFSELIELDAWSRREVLRWSRLTKGTCA